jgi:hypothetical protein
MRRLVRQVVIVALAVAGSASARGDGGHDIRTHIEIVKTAAGKRVSVYGFSLGMPYARAVERAGEDRIGSFFGAQGPIVSRGVADFGAKASVMLMISDGRVAHMTFAFEGEHAALERIEVRVREALASLPSTQRHPGHVSWNPGGRQLVTLAWELKEGREELVLHVSDFTLLR